MKDKNVKHNILGKERKGGDGSLHFSCHTCRWDGNLSPLLLVHQIVPRLTKMSTVWSELREESQSQKSPNPFSHKAAPVLAFLFYNTQNWRYHKNSKVVVEMIFDSPWSFILFLLYKSNPDASIILKLTVVIYIMCKVGMKY